MYVEDIDAPVNIGGSICDDIDDSDAMVVMASASVSCSLRWVVQMLDHSCENLVARDSRGMLMSDFDVGDFCRGFKVLC